MAVNLCHYCKRTLREILGSWQVHLSTCTRVHEGASVCPLILWSCALNSEMNQEKKNHRWVCLLLSQMRKVGCFLQLFSAIRFFTETKIEGVKQQKQLTPEHLSILGIQSVWASVGTTLHHPCWTSPQRENMEGSHRKLTLCLCIWHHCSSRLYASWHDPGWPGLFS